MDARTREALEGVWAHVGRYERLAAEALARPEAEEQDLDACHVYMAGTLPLLLKPLRALLDVPEAPLRGEAYVGCPVEVERCPNETGETGDMMDADELARLKESIGDNVWCNADPTCDCEGCSAVRALVAEVERLRAAATGDQPKAWWTIERLEGAIAALNRKGAETRYVNCGNCGAGNPDHGGYCCRMCGAALGKEEPCEGHHGSGVVSLSKELGRLERDTEEAQALIARDGWINVENQQGLVNGVRYLLRHTMQMREDRDVALTSVLDMQNTERDVERLRAWEAEARAAMEAAKSNYHTDRCDRVSGFTGECTCYQAALRAVLARKVGP